MSSITLFLVLPCVRNTEVFDSEQCRVLKVNLFLLSNLLKLILKN